MIVLRLTHQGRHREVRSLEPRLLLGSTPEADVVEEGSGWDAAEAVVHHRGTEVLLERPGSGSSLRMRVGDEVRLGRVRVALVGLLPIEAPVETPPPLFGDYADDLPGGPDPAGPTFELVDESEGGSRSPGSSTAPTSPPRRPAKKETGPRRSPSSPPAESSSDRGAPPAKANAPAEKTPAATAASSAAPAGQAGTTSPPPPSRGDVPPPRPPSPAFKPPSFGEELVTQLKRAPFFMLSVAVHAIVFFVLAFLEAPDDGGSRRGEDGSLHARLDSLAEEARLAEIEDGEDSSIPSPSLPDIPEPQLPDEETNDDAGEKEKQDGLTLEPLPTPEDLPFEVGLNPSLSSVRARKGGTRTPVPAVDPRQAFNKVGAGGANQQAAEFVRAQLGRGTGRTGDPLDSLAQRDLLVVQGGFDNIGKVLNALRLPYTLVPPTSIARESAPGLSQHKVIFWNCGESLPPSRRAIATRRLRKFVKDGGFLFTTDWGVGNVLQGAFPGYLGTMGPLSPLPEVVVDIRPAKGAKNHPLLDGVFSLNAEGRWWLEQASFDVKVLNKKAVKVLIESPDLKKHFERPTAVAVTFPFGRGRVLHVMGHYYQEEGNLAGTISAHRLALNFVLMRLRQR